MSGVVLIPFILAGIIAGAVAGSMVCIAFTFVPTEVQYAVSGGCIAVGCVIPAVGLATMVFPLTGGEWEVLMPLGMVTPLFLCVGVILLCSSLVQSIATSIYGSLDAGGKIVGVFVSFAISFVLLPCFVCYCSDSIDKMRSCWRRPAANANSGNAVPQIEKKITSLDFPNNPSPSNVDQENTEKNAPENVTTHQPDDLHTQIESQNG
jgi:hypothetical protein